MILLCTLGASWSVVPEIIGFLDPARLPLLSRHPDGRRLDRLRSEYGLEPPAEVWVVTTGAAATAASLDSLRRWWEAVGRPFPLRCWRADGTAGVDSEAGTLHVREMILRAALAASEVPGGCCVSLAGGRKTMSADVQYAGSLFGARALVHVVVREPIPEALRQPDPLAFAEALPPHLAAAVVPLIVGRASRSEALDIPRGLLPSVRSSDFPLPKARPDGVPAPFPASPTDHSLSEEVESRQKDASRLLGNYLSTVTEGETHENWRSLYRLPPSRIAELRETAIGPEHLRLLRALPKADLHLHLGGCLDVPAQRVVGRSVWEALPRRKRDAALARVRPLLGKRTWPLDLQGRLGQPGEARAAAAAALLVHVDDEALSRRLFSPTEPRFGLKARRCGFRGYEMPGDLSGSSLLGHEAAVEPYAREAYRAVRRAGCRYAELRGSPSKYLGRDGSNFLRLFERAIRSAAQEEPGCEVRFVVIADRRRRKTLADVVALALRARGETSGFVVGLDLAGEERRGNPATIAPAFEAAFRECLPLTIHAGEGEGPESIWRAAYLLHADRIGHGLSLAEGGELARRFRDRRICLELCPSSNLEVVGFRDPANPASNALPEYPLARLLRLGIPLTLCTDNPGISRTELAAEYVVASRLAGGLTLWDALALMKHAFQHAFLPSPEREQLLKAIDREVFGVFSTATR